MLNLLDSKQFVKIYDNWKKRIEGKVQRYVRRTINKVDKDEYLKICRTGSLSGKFYGSTKFAQTSEEWQYKRSQSEYLRNLKTI